MGNGEVAAGGATCPGSPRRPSPPPRGHHPVVERGSARWRGSELWGQPGRQGATRPPTLRLLWRGITAGISAGGERRALGQQLWVSFPPALPRESARPARRECSPCVCRISTAVCAPLLIRLHNTPCASCPAAGPGAGMVPGSTAGPPGPPQTS